MQIYTWYAFSIRLLKLEMDLNIVNSIYYNQCPIFFYYVLFNFVYFILWIKCNKSQYKPCLPSDGFGECGLNDAILGCRDGMRTDILEPRRS